MTTCNLKNILLKKYMTISLGLSVKQPEIIKKTNIFLLNYNLILYSVILQYFSKFMLHQTLTHFANSNEAHALLLKREFLNSILSNADSTDQQEAPCRTPVLLNYETLWINSAIISQELLLYLSNKRMADIYIIYSVDVMHPWKQKKPLVFRTRKIVIISVTHSKKRRLCEFDTQHTEGKSLT